MRLAALKGDKSIDELAARLFRLPGGDPQARKLATDALVRANPQLASLGSLPSGAVVVVPDTPLAVNASEVVQPMSTAAADQARSVAEHIAAFMSGLEGAARNAIAQANATLQLLQDPALKQAAESDQALKQRLTQIQASANATSEDVKNKQDMLQKAVAQMQQDLAKFFPPPAG